jgi:O-antigen/teichoic acid export membrane protein
VALRQTAARSILWSALENGSVSVIAFLSLIILAKLLQPSDFGVFSVSLAVVEIAGIFTNMIFHDALIQRNIATDDHFKSAFTVSVILSLIVYALLWLGVPYLASLIGDDRVQDVVRVLGLGLLITGPAGVLAARRSREFEFRLLAMRTLAGRLSGIVLAIISAFLGLGFWALVIQHLATMVLGSATLLLWNPYRELRVTTDLRPLRDLLSYSFAAITSLAASFLTKRIFVFCVGMFLGTETAGFLNLAFRLVDSVWSISATAVAQVLLPTLARLQTDRLRLIEAYRTSLKGASTILYPIFATLGLLAPELIQLVFGDKWTPSSLYVLALSALTFVQVAGLPATPVLRATNHIKDVCLINVFTLLNMLAVIAITHLSSDYVALAVWSAAELLSFAATAIALHFRLRIPISQQLGDVLTPLLAATSMVLTVHIARDWLAPGLAAPWRLLELGVVGGFTYVAFMLAFGRRFVVPVFAMARVLLAKE